MKRPCVKRRTPRDVTWTAKSTYPWGGPWKEPMNKQRMLELALELEHPNKLKVKFNMSDFIEMYPTPYSDKVSDQLKFDCGTSACIGGHACLMFGEEGSRIGEEEAKELLDLTQEQAEQLFYNVDHYIGDFIFGEITRGQAAAAVRRMVATEG